MTMGSLGGAKRGFPADQSVDLPCERRPLDTATMDDNYKRMDDNYTSETIIRTARGTRREPGDDRQE
jgi:hypothetical protein